jgi:hypothetical protein
MAFMPRRATEETMKSTPKQIRDDHGPADPAPMVKCRGCGFNVEQRDVQDWGEFNIGCERCARCTPDVREAYRRGFNAGLDALAESVVRAVKDSNPRKRPTL